MRSFTASSPESSSNSHRAGVAAAGTAAASRFAWQSRHRVIPRMSQMMQMKVPQSTHG
jgi:hypothetical protein